MLSAVMLAVVGPAFVVMFGIPIVILNQSLSSTPMPSIFEC